MAERSTNAPELSVSELSGAIKRTMEDAFGQVRVRGEVSGWRGPHSSGHAYFCLKDDRARLEAVIWKSGFSRLKIRPEEGMEVIATGKVSTFPGSSKYQLVIETLEPAGVGALLAQLEERRKRLAAEGLFAPERKRALPFLPASIGVVTSPTGAVIRDILHRLAERFPRPVLVWPVRVQGDTSAAEVAAAIRGFNALPEAGPIRRPDLLIVARGGGSLEDLWGFNDEAVVRAAAESRIPLISAVGHETDTTLIDHAADRRAPTPTAAAEMAVPVRTELLAALAGLQARREGGLRRLFARRRTELLAAARALPGAEAVLALPRQRTDAAGARLAPALRSDVRFRALALAALSRRLDAQSPRLRLERQRARADGLGERLGRAAPSGPARKRDQLLALSGRLQRALAGRIALERRDLAARDARVIAAHARLAPGIASALRHRATRLAAQHRLMESLGYVAVLKRGFALVRGADGHAVRTAELPGGMPLELEFCDGRVRAVTGERAKAVAVRRSMPQPTLQDSLF